MSDTAVRVRGGATDVELAAVLALVASVDGRPKSEDGYTRWRRTRLAALANGTPRR